MYPLDKTKHATPLCERFFLYLCFPFHCAISLRRKQKVLFVDEVHEDAPIEEVKEASTGFSMPTN